MVRPRVYPGCLCIPEEPLCEALKEKPGWPLRSNDEEDSDQGYQPKNTAIRKWNKPKKNKCFIVKKDERN